MNDPRDLLEDSPLYLIWKRQGKVWWDEEWMEDRGPVRQRIPDLDDHISFANYDLKLNDLPLIETTSEGRPFVRCLAPLSKEELASVQVWAIDNHARPIEVDHFMKRVYERLIAVTGILDVVHHHGFEPMARTPGLEFLDSLVPRKGLRRVEYRKLDP